MKLTVYQYAKCGTCRKAVKWLEAKGHELELIPIFDTPPSKDELTKLIQKSGLEVKKFFNTSGEVYKKRDSRIKFARHVRGGADYFTGFQWPPNQTADCDGW